MDREGTRRTARGHARSESGDEQQAFREQQEATRKRSTSGELISFRAFFLVCDGVSLAWRPPVQVQKLMEVHKNSHEVEENKGQ